MPRKTQPTKGLESAAEELSPDVKLLLDEISREPAPERLLQLARRLQAALKDRVKVDS